MFNEQSKRIDYTGYPFGLIDVSPRQVKHDIFRNNWYVEHEGKVYNCHPKAGAVWPVRFEVKYYDLGIYPEVGDLFPHIFTEDNPNVF